tara:strand:- start:43060 stop:43182 length:123 start_codon:yes stop_codon:yes gene_type:complete
MDSRINDKAEKAHATTVKVLQGFFIAAMTVVFVIMLQTSL